MVQIQKNRGKTPIMPLPGISQATSAASRAASLAAASLKGPVMNKQVHPRPSTPPPPATPSAPKPIMPPIPLDKQSSVQPLQTQSVIPDEATIEAAGNEFASEFIGKITAETSGDSHKTKRKKEVRHTQHTITNAPSSTELTPYQALSKRMAAIYKKIYALDHDYHQKETTLSTRSWHDIVTALNLEDLVENVNDGKAIDSAQDKYKNLKLTNLELKRLAKFKQNADTVTEGRISITPQIAKILKHAIRNAMFLQVATPQDLGKQSTREAAVVRGKLASFVPPLKPIEWTIKYIPDALFFLNAALRQAIQGGTHGLKEWIYDKAVTKAQTTTQPLKRTVSAISRTTHPSPLQDSDV